MWTGSVQECHTYWSIFHKDKRWEHRGTGKWWAQDNAYCPMTAHPTQCCMCEREDLTVLLKSNQLNRKLCVLLKMHFYSRKSKCVHNILLNFSILLTWPLFYLCFPLILTNSILGELSWHFTWKHKTDYIFTYIKLCQMRCNLPHIF